MAKIIKISGAILVMLGLIFFAVFYHLTGATKVAEISRGVLQIYNENLFERVGANMTVFETDVGLVSVDAHLAPLAKRARNKMAQHAQSKLIAVFNTHWHPDHTGGNGALTAEADIIAHKNVRKTLSQKHKGIGLTKPGSKHNFEPIATPDLPEILIDRGEQSFLDYGATFRAVHYPSAHTDGDLVIFAPDFNVVVLGDLVWPDAFPFVDVHNGGTAPGLRDALTDILSSTDDNQIFAIGHGAPISRDDLAEYLTMVKMSIDHVEREKSAGKTLELIQTSGFPATLRGWESKLVPSAEWIKMIYETI